MEFHAPLEILFSLLIFFFFFWEKSLSKNKNYSLTNGFDFDFLMHSWKKCSFRAFKELILSCEIYNVYKENNAYKEKQWSTVMVSAKFRSVFFLFTKAWFF